MPLGRLADRVGSVGSVRSPIHHKQSCLMISRHSCRRRIGSSGPGSRPSGGGVSSEDQLDDLVEVPTGEAAALLDEPIESDEEVKVRNRILLEACVNGKDLLVALLVVAVVVLVGVVVGVEVQNIEFYKHKEKSLQPSLQAQTLQGKISE
ncbi:hypothetical protein B484DRAFT_230708 [Ochromonadaceae sp. CCMP2298]|nr:hypothetical protein B484DRAFT_230708 [Ochromonadaceae sp. CCMP2298]